LVNDVAEIDGVELLDELELLDDDELDDELELLFELPHAATVRAAATATPKRAALLLSKCMNFLLLGRGRGARPALSPLASLR
jgi:hypothetical protein